MAYSPPVLLLLLGRTAPVVLRRLLPVVLGWLLPLVLRRLLPLVLGWLLPLVLRRLLPLVLRRLLLPRVLGRCGRSAPRVVAIFVRRHVGVSIGARIIDRLINDRRGHVDLIFGAVSRKLVLHVSALTENPDTELKVLLRDPVVGSCENSQVE